MQNTTLTVNGLYTDPSALSEVPQGALARARNVNIDRAGIAEKRRGFKAFGNTITPAKIFFFDDKVWVDDGGVCKYWDGAVWATNTGTTTLTGNVRFAVSAGKSLFVADDLGIKKITSSAADPTLVPAGLPAPVVREVNWVWGTPYVQSQIVAYRFTSVQKDEHGVLIESAPSDRTVFLPQGFSNAFLLRPSFEIDVGDVDVTLRMYRSEPISALQTTPPLTLPADTYTLVMETPVSAGVSTITDTFVTGVDGKGRPAGTALYTNATQDGAVAANIPPPGAYDAVEYNGYLFYIRPSAPYRATVQYDPRAVGGLALGETFTITDDSGSTSFTAAHNDFGAANTFRLALDAFAIFTAGDVNSATNIVTVDVTFEDGDVVWFQQFGSDSAPDPLTFGSFYRVIGVSSTTVALYPGQSDGDVSMPGGTWIDLTTTGSGKLILAGAWDLPTPDATSIDASATSWDIVAMEITARSLCRNLNKTLGASGYSVSYIGGADSTAVGTLLIQSASPFSVTSNAANDCFVPTLLSGATIEATNDYADNKFAWSKQYQRESVPLTNTHPGIGSATAKILRGIATRDSLIFLKEDGAYKLTGAVDTDFRIDPIDTSYQFVAPQTAVLLDNAIYCMTTVGVARVTDLGVTIMSNPIRKDLLALRGETAAAQEAFDASSTAFVLGDKYVLCCAVWNGAAVDYSIQYVLNTRTGAWTSWDGDIQFGGVNPADGKLYVYRGNSYVEVQAVDGDADSFQDHVSGGTTLEPVEAEVGWTVKTMGNPTMLSQFSELTVMAEAGTEADADVTTSTDVNQGEVTQVVSVKTGRAQPSRLAVPRNHQRASTLEVTVMHSEADSFEVSGLTVTGQLTSEKTSK